MDFENILIHQKENILLITINREAKLNALNKATLEELHRAVSDASKNTSVKGIILTGAGQKAFVAGADIPEFTGLTEEEGRELAFNAQTKVFDVIENCEKPIIAAINGYALGGGLELALAAHIRIASENSKFGFPEVTLGLIPGFGGTQRITKLIGKGRAMEMILTAEMISAEKALTFGLVNAVYPQAQLLSSAEDLMKRILKNSGSAIKHAIIAINSTNTGEGFKTEINEFGKCFGHPDFKEGVNAFIEKRKPKF